MIYVRYVHCHLCFMGRFSRLARPEHYFGYLYGHPLPMVYVMGIDWRIFAIDEKVHSRSPLLTGTPDMLECSLRADNVSTNDTSQSLLATPQMQHQAEKNDVSSLSSFMLIKLFSIRPSCPAKLCSRVFSRTGQYLPTISTRTMYSDYNIMASPVGMQLRQDTPALRYLTP